jgi:hypothetical protein
MLCRSWFAILSIAACSGDPTKLGSNTAAEDVQCDQTPQTFYASTVLYSSKHHVNAPYHIHIPVFGEDEKETCDRDYCSSFFRHGRSAMIKWDAWCFKNPAEIPGTPCVARVKVDPQNYHVSGTNVGGGGQHWHIEDLWGYTCAFKDLGNGLQGTYNCSVSGDEKIIKVESMVNGSDGVAYGTGYAANHDDSGTPQIGLFVGYGVGGAFITLQPGAGATYRKGGAWAQGMGCDSNGKPYKLPDDGNGHPFPAAGSGDGNE